MSRKNQQMMWSVIPNNSDDDLTQQKSIILSDIVPFQQQNDADMTAQDVVTTCMNALLQNDKPRMNAGLKVCFITVPTNAVLHWGEI